MNPPICTVLDAEATAQAGKVRLRITLHEHAEFIFELSAAAVPLLCSEMLFAARQAKETPNAQLDHTHI